MDMYDDYNVDTNLSPEEMWNTKVANLIGGEYSVEILNVVGGKYIVRVWHEKHCDRPEGHE